MKRIFIGIVQFYKNYISPLTPPSCRFHPSCSTYMIDAIEMHGVIKGGTMGIARILRCNPFVKGGVDPVPDYFTLRRNKRDKDIAESMSEINWEHHDHDEEYEEDYYDEEKMDEQGNEVEESSEKFDVSK